MKQTNETKQTKEMSSWASAAKMIREELKENFPTTKFRVTSEGFSMGDAVNISWTDGPVTEQVEEFTKKYQYGHFDGMIDLYEHSNSREDIPQSKYVMVHRDISEETRQMLVKIHNAKFCESGQIKDLEAWNENALCWNSSIIWRDFGKADLQAGTPLWREFVRMNDSQEGK